jgi:hexosaminidase
VILEEMGVQYGNETVAISFETQTSKNGITVKLEENFRNPQTTYSLTNSYENHKTTQAYKGENIQITQNGKNTLQLQARTELTSNYEPSTLNFNLHNWLTASTNYSVPYSDYYTAGGDDGLTDGVLGSLDFRDGHWQGFFGEDIELIIKNPNTDKTTSSVSMNFYRYINSWIFPPESVLVSASTDGKMFAELDSYSYAEEEMHIRGQEILSPSFSFSPVNANYLKVSVKNIGKVPHWHEASSEPAWIFVDEIIIN